MFCIRPILVSNTVINAQVTRIRFKVFAKTFVTDIEKHKRDIMARGLPKVKPIAGVKHIILIASSKGGVGKSTTAVNLAVSLKMLQPEKQVGLLDTDIFGPSIPLMMNLQNIPLLTKNGMFEPLINYGVKCMSMGFMIEEGVPVVWRGLMVMQALEKLLRNVYWESIDYLVVDTPPGTGDTQLSLIQNIPISGAILVTTPQFVATQVTKRGARMFKNLNIPIIGIVENMCAVKCPVCCTSVPLFGTDTATMAHEIGTDVLQQILLEQEISNTMDKGIPIIVAKPDCDETIAYKTIGEKVIKYLNKFENTYYFLLLSLDLLLYMSYFTNGTYFILINKKF